MASEIVVVDYHKGNLLSVARSVSSLGAQVEISDDPRVIAQAKGIILPGVGSFEDAMDYMGATGQAQALTSSIRAGVPFLGICLGLQLLYERGFELASPGGDGWVPGLGVLAGSVTRLEPGRLKVPHVGWNQLHLTEHGRGCPVLTGVAEGSHVYFTHSFAVADDADEALFATRTHYTRSFASSVWRDNVFGVQFHPEKSSALGLRILSNFLSCVRG